MNTITVTTTADRGNGSLRNAIEKAKSGDTIRFAKNLSKKTIGLTSGQLVINKDLTIDGAGAAGLTISGNRKSRVFYVDKKRKATFRNLTIANGKTLGAGGGIDARHESELTLVNVAVKNNASELGGGVRVGHLAKGTFINSQFVGNNGTLSKKFAGFSSGAIAHNESRGQIIIKGSRFENNKGFNGGAIYSFSSVTFDVENSVFLNNTAKNKAGGGAIMTDGVSSKNYNAKLPGEGKIAIRGSRFEGNSADGVGGALYLWGYEKDRAIIENTVIQKNTATNNNGGRGQGGGLWVKMQLDLRNVTLAGNTATKQGGGLWLETQSPVNILNSTFSGNAALGDAGGAMFLKNKALPINITNTTLAYNKAGRAAGALWFDKNQKVNLKNSIVAYNTAGTDRRQDQVAYQPIDRGGNLEFALSPKAQRVTNKTLVANPRLAPLRSVNGSLVHTLGAGSPAINAGVKQGAPLTDQRGVKRDSKIDIGAFEKVGGQTAPIAPKPTTAPIAPPPSTGQPKPPNQPKPPIAAPTAPKFSKKPVAYFNFNQNSGRTVKDTSNNGKRNNGKLVGKTNWTKGAIDLSGQGSGININNTSDINIGTDGQKTVSLRFKADSLAKSKQVLYEQGGGLRGLNIYLDKNRLFVGGWNRPTNESNWSGDWVSTKVAAGKWNQVDLVLDGGKQVANNSLRGYLNGKQFGSRKGSQLWSHSGGIGIGHVNADTRFHDGMTSSSGKAFAGLIDDVMIFDSALSGNDLSGLG